MAVIDENTKTILQRDAFVLLGVGVLSSIGVYLGHDWFHASFLPALGVSAALGDALGGLAVILAAYAGQRAVSLLFFHDIALGSIRTSQRLREVNREIQSELCELDRLACTDRLTGAWNRRRLEDALVGEIERHSRYGHPLSILVLDIDHFKRINDQLGHATGDKVLVEFAERLRRGLRATDMLVRWGGEEFIVLCPNSPISTAARLSRRLHQIVRATEFPEVGQVTVSIGVAEFQTGDTWDSWFMRADAAVYRAKQDGRDRVHVVPTPLAPQDQAESIDAGFVRLVWRSAYESGHADIDQQHRALFDLSNDLMDALMSGRSPAEAGEIIRALIDEITSHFACEEVLIRDSGYPGAEEHVVLHRELAEKATDLVHRFHAGAAEVGEMFQFLALDVVVRHMLGADRDYFPWLEPQPRAAEG